MSCPALNRINLSIKGGAMWGDKVVRRDRFTGADFLSDMEDLIIRGLSWEAFLIAIYKTEGDLCYLFDELCCEDEKFHRGFAEISFYHLYGQREKNYVGDRCLLPQWLCE